MSFCYHFVTLPVTGNKPVTVTCYPAPIRAVTVTTGAEIRLGELLLATERNQGAKGNPHGRGALIVRSPDVTTQPTLSVLQIIARRAKENQVRKPESVLAKLPKQKPVRTRAEAQRLAKVPSVGHRLANPAGKHLRILLDEAATRLVKRHFAQFP